MTHLPPHLSALLPLVALAALIVGHAALMLFGGEAPSIGRDE